MIIALAFIGALINVSRVPSLRSSAIVLIVRNGISAGAPKRRPSTSDDKGGRIQLVAGKLSMKKRKPTPNKARK
jgi:hypothetical protein